MEDHSTPDLRMSYQPRSIRVLHRLAVRPRCQRLARPLRRDHEPIHARTRR
jgi:hypothetical protein